MSFNHYIIDCNYITMNRKNSDGYLHLLKIHEYESNKKISIHHVDIFDKTINNNLNCSQPFECKLDLVPEIVMRMYFPYGTLQDYYIERI